MIRIKVDYSSLDKELEKAIQEYKVSMAKELSKIGEKYIAEARSKGSFTDRTGNLRNANSYVVYLDGVPLFQSVGRDETSTMFEEVKSAKGLQLIVGNGMEYASYVEGKGFDVSSAGFIKVREEISKLIRQK